MKNASPIIMIELSEAINNELNVMVSNSIHKSEATNISKGTPLIKMAILNKKLNLTKIDEVKNELPNPTN